MCGIVGFLDERGSAPVDPGAALRAMAGTLSHRGPDHEGFWVDAAPGVHLGFRRLAILDLSEAGHQPMVSASGRFVVVFNGEIYNFAELRAELGGAGWTFRGHSDTEVLLAAVERWGVVASLPRLRGMFAFAIWDREDRALFLARDRLGIKPLYLARNGPFIGFASELRALLAYPGLQRRGSAAAAWHFLRHLYVPGPLSIVEGVEKVAPGTVVRVSLREGGAADLVAESYWRLTDSSEKGVDPEVPEEEMLERLHELLVESVRLRLVADVPVGALLSGGIDSSLVVALMQAQSPRPVRTFTIRFDDPRFDEGPIAAEVARRLGTAHTEVELSTARIRDEIPTLSRISDEPMANPSLLPTLFVCEVARRDVTVALTGDGGDELFGGYNRYVQGERLIRAAGRIPAGLRPGAARVLRTLAHQDWTEPLGRLLQPRELGDQHTFSSRVARVAALVGTEDELTAYQNLMAVGTPTPPLPHPPRGEPFASDRAFRAHRGELLGRMMLHDQLQYLPDDLLAKVDRASMWVSLEARVPLLDHVVAEFSWRLPRSWCIRDGETKWPLRKLVQRYLPREIFERPKMGFTVPLDRWLRTDLASWVQDTLDETKLRRRGLVEPEVVRSLHARFRKGRKELALPLWSLAVLEDWCEAWGVSF